MKLISSTTHRDASTKMVRAVHELDLHNVPQLESLSGVHDGTQQSSAGGQRRKTPVYYDLLHIIPFTFTFSMARYQILTGGSQRLRRTTDAV